MARKPWRDLTPAYRRRLQRQGFDAKSHREANLIRARGHVETLPPGSINPSYIDTYLREPPPYEALKNLAKKFTRPSWVPDYVAVDAAAALSQLPNPKSWESVELIPRPDDEAWTMIVHRKGNAYDRETLIPGGGGPGSGAKDVLQLLTELQVNMTPGQRRRRRVEEEEAIFFEVLGTDDATLEREVGRKHAPGSRWHYTADHATALDNPRITLDVFKPEAELRAPDLIGHPRCRNCERLVGG